jgi:hypothetical protein
MDHPMDSLPGYIIIDFSPDVNTGLAFYSKARGPGARAEFKKKTESPDKESGLSENLS